jgi:hypothetical protein
MNLFDFITTQAKKAGVSGNADLTTILTDNADALKAIELPPVVTNLIGTNLMDKNQALNNEEIAGHFYGKLGGGIESDLFPSLADELEEAEIAEIKSINGTGKKVAKTIEKFKAKIESIKNGSKGGSKEANEEIKRLQLEIADLKDLSVKSINETSAKYRTKLEQIWRKSNINFDWNEAYDPELRTTVYNAAIDSELAASEAKILFDEETGSGNIVSSKNPEMKVFDEKGKEISFADIHLRALQNKKLLAQAPGGGDPDKSRTPFTVLKKDDGTNVQMANFAKAEIAEGLAALQEMAKNQ